MPRTVKLRQVEQELAIPGLSATRQQQLRNSRAELKTEISDLQKYSYLLGGADPYVVLPGSMFGKKLGQYAPAVGDYCVVIYENVLYPAVIGDVGPNDIVGEASLRICRQINARADPNNRPVNDLKATYLIFPGSADRPFDVPDLDKWRTRCDALLKDLGGYQGTLFAWEDLTKPKPPPATPAPAPAPAPATPAPAGPATPAPTGATPAGTTPPPKVSPATPGVTPKPAAASATPATTPKPAATTPAVLPKGAAPAVTPAPTTPAPASTPTSSFYHGLNGGTPVWCQPRDPGPQSGWNG